MARTFRRQRTAHPIADLNLTNLIDLGFTLLIIFMIATPLINQEQTIPVTLPTESKSAQQKPDPKTRFVAISVDARGNIYLMKKQWSGAVPGQVAAENSHASDFPGEVTKELEGVAERAVGPRVVGGPPVVLVKKGALGPLEHDRLRALQLILQEGLVNEVHVQGEVPEGGQDTVQKFSLLIDEVVPVRPERASFVLVSDVRAELFDLPLLYPLQPLGEPLPVEQVTDDEGTLRVFERVLYRLADAHTTAPVSVRAGTLPEPVGLHVIRGRNQRPTIHVDQFCRIRDAFAFEGLRFPVEGEGVDEHVPGKERLRSGERPRPELRKGMAPSVVADHIVCTLRPS